MKIVFLNNLILWALPASLIPVLFHIFKKRNPKKVEFSEIRLIKLAYERIKKGSRLKKYLLLLIRTLILVCLILIFAMPTIQYGSGNRDDSNEGASFLVILAVDSSYSMLCRDTGKTRFEENISKAKKIVSILPPYAKVGVISYSDRVESATAELTTDKEYLLKYLDELKCSNRTTDLSSTFLTVDKLFSPYSSGNRTLILLSDGAKHGFNEKKDLNIKDSRIILFESQETGNTLVSDVFVSYDNIARRWLVNDIVKVFGKPEIMTAVLSYKINGKKAGIETVELDKEIAQSIRPFVHYSDTTRFMGSSELQSDRLNADNVFYFVSDRKDDPKICIVDGDPKSGGVTAESYYVRTALPEAETFGESEIDNLGLQKYDLMILLNLRYNHVNIEEAVEKGSKAIVFLGDHYSDSANAEYFPNEIGSQFNEDQSISWVSQNSDDIKGINVAEYDLEKLIVNKGFASHPKSGTKILAKYSSGWPFITEAGFGKGKAILITSSADREWNNLPAKPLFVPLLKALIDHLLHNSENEIRTNYIVGDPIRQRTFTQVTITMPSGSIIRPLIGSNEFVFDQTHEPGIYKISNGDGVESYVSVNLDRSTNEGDLALMPQRELTQYFKGNHLTLLSNEEWDKQLLAVIFGKDISRYLILAVLLLILTEVYLANPRYKK